MNRRYSLASVCTLLLVAVSAAGCPGGSNPTTPTKTTRPSSSNKTPKPGATSTATPAATASPTTKPTGSPSATAAPTASPSGTAAPTASPTASATASPALSNAVSYAADLPISNNVGAGGTAIATLADDAKSLKVSLFVTGTTGDVTMAHLHEGAEGVTGAVVKTLTVDATAKRSAMGTWTTTDATEPMTTAHVTALKAGNLYAAIHTAANPGGEARGNLKPFSAVYAADMRPVAGATNATAARGVAWFAQGADKSATIKVYTSGLTGDITMAHVHKGAATETGAVVKELVVGADKKTVTGTWTFGTTEGALTDALIAELKAGKLYVAVHTAQNPGGEIRGQLMAP